MKKIITGMLSLAFFCQSGCGLIGQTVYGWTEITQDTRRGRQKIRITSNPDGATIERSESAQEQNSKTVGEAPVRDSIAYNVDVRTKVPSSSWPLWLGVTGAVAGAVAVASEDAFPSFPFIISGTIDLIAAFIQMARKDSRTEQSRGVGLRYLATLEDGRSQEKKIVVPSRTGKLHFEFLGTKRPKTRRSKRIPSRVGDLQIIGPKVVRVWINGKEYYFDDDGGIFLGNIEAGVHRMRASADGYEVASKKVVVREDRTTMVKISKLGLDSKVLTQLDRIQLPRHSCSLVLRSAKAHPNVRYEIRHQAPDLSESVKKVLMGDLPIEILDFAVGTFEVTFRKGRHTLKQQVTAKKDEEINLRADFSNQTVDVKVSR